MQSSFVFSIRDL